MIKVGDATWWWEQDGTEYDSGIDDDVFTEPLQ